MDKTENQPFTSKDHDLLIAINVKMDTIMAKNDGFDGRIKTLESIVDKTDPIKSSERLKILEQIVHEQQITNREKMRMAMTISSIITFVLTTATMVIGILTGILKLSS